jgi:hypothetical protein
MAIGDLGSGASRRVVESQLNYTRQLAAFGDQLISFQRISSQQSAFNRLPALSFHPSPSYRPTAIGY